MSQLSQDCVKPCKFGGSGDAGDSCKLGDSEKGLAAQSKAEAIGQNKISSANQRPGFQMIFFSFWSGLIYCYELCVYGSKVMIVVEYSVHEQHMNPFICPFPLEKD